MPTAQQWKDALSVPRQVHVESSAALVTAVQAKQQARARWLQARALSNNAKTPATFPPFSPSKDILVRPIDLLHSIGLTTTPPVANLVDICSWWAYYRYLWAFALPGRRTSTLRLSAEAKQIDFHQKALLSDEVGVGMAAYLMSTYCGTPQSIDVDVAIRRRVLPVRTQDESSPDYIFFDAAQTRYFVVECKGTQTSRSAAVKQMQRGTEQVPSLVFANGAPSVPLVVATHLSKTATNVYVIDPPADDLPPDPKRIRESRPVESAPNRWEVDDWRGFAAASRAGVQARLLAFAGDDEAAQERLATVVPIEPQHRPFRRTLQIRETPLGDYEGVEDVLPSRDGVRLAIFRGVERNVIDRARSADDEAFAEIVAETERRLAGYRDPTSSPEESAFKSTIGEDEQDAIAVRSAGPEGSLLEIRVDAR